VKVQCLTGRAWMLLKEGKNDEALHQMKQAAELEDKSEKHPVTPGDVLPARELLGDLLMQMNNPVEALAMYEASLKKNPNRFNGLYGAGRAAQMAGNTRKASDYYIKLRNVADKNSTRPELLVAKKFQEQEP
jgi:tetratricopeptide (TPR) repeat protein